MEKPNHIIQRQILELKIDDARMHHELSEQLANIFRQKLLPELELLFEGLAGKKHIRIEKLEVELPVLKLSDWQFHLPDVFLKAITAELYNQLEQSYTGNLTEEKTTSTHQKTPQQSIIEVFEFFLQHGLYPWWYEAKPLVFLEQQLRGMERALLKKSLKGVLKSPQARERFVYQFSPSFFEYSIECLGGDTAAASQIDAWEKLIIHTRFKTPSSFQMQPMLKKALLYQLAYGATPIDFSLFAANLANDLSKQLSMEKVDVLLALYKGLPQLDLEEKTLNQIKEDIKRLFHQDHISVEGKGEATRLEGDYYIENAGLVLVGPYLPRLFDHLGLLHTDQSFSSVKSQQRAVQLLHYFTNNSQDCEEHLLPLNKLICGYPLQYPIERYFEPAKEEKKQLLLLQEAMIEHWSALKNTSPATLQQSFFQRSGKLIQAAESKYWELTVNRETIDVLLDKIPWSFSFIKLPWMSKPIKVHW